MVAQHVSRSSSATVTVLPLEGVIMPDRAPLGRSSVPGRLRASVMYILLLLLPLLLLRRTAAVLFCCCSSLLSSAQHRCF